MDKSQLHNYSKIQIIGLIIGPLAAIVIWFLPSVFSLSLQGQHFFAVFVCAIVFWVTLPIPAEFTALLMITIPWLLNDIPLDVAFSGWMNRTTWFMFGALIVGRVVTETGFDKRITYFLLSKLKRLSGTYNGILLAIFIIIILVSLIVPSGMVITTVVCALVFPLISAFGVDKNSNIGKAIMLIVPTMVLIVGRETLTGSVANIVLWGFLEAEGQTMSWLAWFLANFPSVLVMGLLTYFMFISTIKPEVSKVPNGSEYFVQKSKELGPMRLEEKKAAILFSTALILWATGTYTNISVNQVALGIAIVAILPGVGVMDFKSAISKTNWSIMFFVAAIVSLPSIMEYVGMSEAFQSVFTNLAQYIKSPLIFIVVLWLFSQLCGWLGLGLAAPIIITPIMFPIAYDIGIPLSTVILMQCLFRPAVLYYHATHPLIGASYGTYEQRDFAKFGFVIAFLWLPIVIFMYYCWYPILIGWGLL